MDKTSLPKTYRSADESNIQSLKTMSVATFESARELFFRGHMGASALRLKKWYFLLVQLYDLEGLPAPAPLQDPEFYFLDEPGDNEQTVPVPRNPYPGIDGNEIKMPLPKEDR